MSATPWAGNHLWLFPGVPLEKAIEDALEFGFDGVLIKTHDGNPADDAGHVYYGLLEKALRIREQQSLDLIIAAWGYLYGPKYGNRQVDIEAQAVIDSIQQGPDWYVVDAEMEWEQPNAAEAVKRLMETVRERYPDYPIGYCPFWNTRWHPRYPYEQFSRYCDVVLPQVYYVLARRQTPERIQAMWRITREDFEPLGLPIAPVGQTHGATVEQIRAFQQAVGDLPRSWWLWDGSTREQLAAAGRSLDMVPRSEYEAALARARAAEQKLGRIARILEEVR